MIKFGDEDSSRFIFLIKTEEDEDNFIRFTVAKSYKGEKGSNIDNSEIPSIKEILSESTPIYPDKNNMYEVAFENYIFYMVRNESYCSWDDYEIRKGHSFIIFEKSRLLDMLPKIIDCQTLSDGSAYPGEWKHYGIYCMNHIIDVISHNKPIITKIETL